MPLETVAGTDDARTLVCCGVVRPPFRVEVLFDPESVRVDASTSTSRGAYKPSSMLLPFDRTPRPVPQSIFRLSPLVPLVATWPFPATCCR